MGDLVYNAIFFGAYAFAFAVARRRQPALAKSI
jgi:hypothetical protein